MQKMRVKIICGLYNINKITKYIEPNICFCSHRCDWLIKTGNTWQKEKLEKEFLACDSTSRSQIYYTDVSYQYNFLTGHIHLSILLFTH